jgi:hypothetical protein
VSRARCSAPSRSLRRFVGQQHAPADLERVLQALEARREGLPVVVAEVRVAGARGQHQRVVAELALVQDQAAAGQIHRLDLGQEHRHVGRASQNRAQGRRDVGRIERGGGHLIEQRLEEVVVAAVEEGDPCRPAREGARRVEPAESPSDDDDVRVSVTRVHEPIFRGASRGVNPVRLTGSAVRHRVRLRRSHS